jgi:hypothetical protein
MICSQCKEKTNSLRHCEDASLCDDCYAQTLTGHFACKECGKHYHSSMTGAELREGLCFSCDFWMEKVDWENDPEERDRCVRIEGNHYHLSEGKFRGFGGRAFRIQFTNGRIVEHNNLWHQGDIPKHFQERLPNNAKFLST